MKYTLSKLACAGLSVLVAVWLAAASFMVVLNPVVTHQLAEATVDTAHSTLSHDYLVATADKARAFALGDDHAGLPRGADDRVAFTPDAISHLLSVRAVFSAVIVIFEIASALVLIIGIPLLTAHRLRLLGSALIAGAAGLMAITAACAIAAWATSFDALFEAMHHLFFVKGTWAFAEDSLLICALPEHFWSGCALVWAAALILLCALATVAGVLLRRRAARRTHRQNTQIPVEAGSSTSGSKR